MWNLNDATLASMKQEIAHLHIEGDDAAAQAWLVWAETYLNTLEVPAPHIPSVQKAFPLIVWLNDTIEASVGDIYNALRESLPRILFQAKLAGRDLSPDDGHVALRILRSSLKEADG